ncbi:hypothetical protein VNO77_16456 [Canavalia gladiata]|uniref:Uncharacterized protein n=1 Tax=Canavalia gladiata TaxID=3824 RepID=A0AAN9QS68_CANGL
MKKTRNCLIFRYSSISFYLLLHWQTKYSTDTFQGSFSPKATQKCCYGVEQSLVTNAGSSTDHNVTDMFVNNRVALFVLLLTINNRVRSTYSLEYASLLSIILVVTYSMCIVSVHVLLPTYYVFCNQNLQFYTVYDIPNSYLPSYQPQRT